MEPTEWEKIFINSTSDRGQIPKICKELKKSNNSVKKWSADLNREFSTDSETLKEIFNILSH